MQDINIVVLIGHTTADCELKYTPNGTATTKFSLAVNGYKDKTDFFDCILWGKLAENLTPYLTKGKRIGINGRLQQETWKNKEGQNRSKVSINVASVEFLDAKKRDDSEPDEDSDHPYVTDDEINF